MALLSALAIPSPWGFIIGGAMLTLVTALLYRNARRRRRGIDGWPNALIVAPFVASTVLVPVAHLVSERLVGALLIGFVIGALMLFVRRLRRPTGPARSPHHFRGASPTD
jgi:ABC-type xylose transport system permease subunit